MKKLLTFLFAILFAAPCFATGVSGDSATCDSGTLSTDTGPTNLRANYESNTLNLKWHDENGTPITSNTCTYGGTITMPTAPTKRGYTFKGWKVITHTPIEYIENDVTNNPYIDTGVEGNNDNYNIITEVMVLEQTTNYPTLISNSCSNCSNYNEWAIISVNFNASFLFYTNTHYIYPRLGNGCSMATGRKNVRYLIDFTYNRAIVNGVQYDYCSETRGTTNNTTIKLFGNNNIKFRMYSFKIYDNGTLIRDMIPVKDSDGVVCMYDKVSKQYFYNAGTGNFIAGPDL